MSIYIFDINSKEAQVTQTPLEKFFFRSGWTSKPSENISDCLWRSLRLCVDLKAIWMIAIKFTLCRYVCKPSPCSWILPSFFSYFGNVTMQPLDLWGCFSCYFGMGTISQGAHYFRDLQFQQLHRIHYAAAVSALADALYMCFTLLHFLV